MIDLRTHAISKVPGSEGLWSPRWSRDGRYVLALTRDRMGLMLFDVRTQKWSSLVKMAVNWPEWSRQGDYIYFHGATLGGQRGLYRVRVSDHKMDLVLSLTDVPAPPGLTREAWSRANWGSWKGLAPDDSPLMLRDAGTQEIYALDVAFPK